MREFELIERLSATLRERGLNPPSPAGIGDDAARVGEHWVSTDALVDGVHFRLDEQSPQAIGWKAAAVSLSDIAAMGARAEALLVAMVLPDLALGEALLAGAADACAPFGVPIVGGDTCRGPVATIVTTALGMAARPVLRSGGQPGDGVWVTGALGGSLLGRHLRFTPRLDEAARLVSLGPPSAMLDLSDGLAGDLGRLCNASGCGAIVDASRLPIHADARRMADQSGRSPTWHALHDGEDFELLFTADRALETVLAAWDGTPLTRVGELVPGDAVQLREGDALTPLAGGYEHG